MSVDVLGTLVIDGGPVSPRERAVLAALALEVGRPLPPERIADALWGEEVPATWAKQVQIAIARLRRHPGTPTITTVPEGYRLDVASDAIDARRFERLVANGRQHLADGAPDRANAVFETALHAWRGEPYADLPDWEPARAEAARLHELRASAEEDLLAARLELGHAASVVSDAERLVRDRPLREHRWALLARALYRSGRQAEALAALRAARRRLDEELGIDPSDELTALETAILRHDPDLEAPSPVAAPGVACPYRGLAAFGEGDEEEFFGRDLDIRAGLARVEHGRFVSFAGQSGCGKSSLVLAGIIPALRREGRSVEVTSPRRGFEPVIAATHDDRDVLVIDQFEELFTGSDAEATDDVATAIENVIESGGTVIVTVRSDFLDACARLPRLGALFTDGVQLVPPMGPEGLRAAIEGPARVAGLRLEPGLTELILRDAVGRPGVLPHVSHALVETWARREGATLTVHGYEASGGLSAAIAQSADRLYLRMPPADRAICRSTMLRLVAIAPDGSPVRQSLSVKGLHDDGARDRVLRMLAAARLISTDETSVQISHEALADGWPRLRNWLEHDADELRTTHALAVAAEAWDAGGRTDEDLSRGARLQSALEWERGGDRDLTEQESAFLAASSARETSEREALVAQARRERTQNRRLRGLLVGAAALIVALVGAGGLAVVSADMAERSRAEANVEALVSAALALKDSERDVAALLAAEAHRRWPEDPRTRAAMMGVLTAAGGFLGNAFVDGVGSTMGAVIPGTDRAFMVDDSGAAAIRDLDTAESIMSIDTGLDDPAPAPWFPLVEVSADGTTGAILLPEIGELVRGATPDSFFWVPDATARSDLVVVDLSSGERLLGPLRLEIGSGALAVEGDGSSIAIAAARDGAVSLVDVQTGSVTPVAGQVTAALELPESYAAALAFTEDGRLFAGRMAGTIEVIDPVRAAVTTEYPVPEESAHVAMDVLESGLVVASGDRAVIAFDGEDGDVRWIHPVTGFGPASCNWIAASEEAGRVYCAGWFGLIDQYELDTGEPVGSGLDALLGTVGQVAVVSGGKELVALSQWLPAISRWKLDGSGLIKQLIAPGSFLAGGYSQDGHALLTADGEGDTGWGSVHHEVAIRDAVSGEVLDVFSAPVYEPTWVGSDAIVGWFPDDERLRLVDAGSGTDIGPPLPSRASRSWVTHAGTRLYVLSGEGTVVGIDPESGERVGEPIVVDGDVIWLSASPDGRRLAMLSIDEGVTLLTMVKVANGEVTRSEHLATGPPVLLDDGTLIGSQDNRMMRFDTDTYEQVGSLPGTAGGLGVPETSDDGATMLMSAGDDTVLLHDTATGIRLAEPFFVNSPDYVGGYLRPDGLELAISDPAGVMTWDLDAEHRFEAVCRIAGRDLTPNEWRSYLDGLGELRSTCGFSEG
jgi:DNA-binding SARP family transcriptional activator/outer membrane protein assembly factor BamB